MNPERKPDTVAVGCWVKIKDPDIGEETIHLVNREEERPAKGLISTSSPFAKALLGAKPGEKVTYPVANGNTEQVEVLEIGWNS